ncbi:hypothetical protein Tco_0069826 [Tanacetum coccineum]
MKLLMKKHSDFEDKYQVWGRIVGIKRLLVDLRVTAAKLMLLMYKLLLLVFRVNVALDDLRVTAAKCKLLLLVNISTASYYC